MDEDHSLTFNWFSHTPRYLKKKLVFSGGGGGGGGGGGASFYCEKVWITSTIFWSTELHFCRVHDT